MEREYRRETRRRAGVVKRLNASGAEGLKDEELLALLWGDGSESDRASRTARDCLEEWNGLRGLCHRSSAELEAAGVPAGWSRRLVAALALGRRALLKPLAVGRSIRSGGDVYSHLRARLGAADQEVFSALLLDARCRIVREIEISRGSLTGSLVHPREVFGPAVRQGACYVLVAHNHPSGDPTPSLEDVEVTRRLRRAGDLLGIGLLDHVIVGEQTYFSFLESGRL